MTIEEHSMREPNCRNEMVELSFFEKYSRLAGYRISEHLKILSLFT